MPIDVNGRAYACDLRGSGPALVVLHAAICDRHMYDPVVDLLLPEHRVLAYDQPGFGETPLAAGAVSPVHDLLALMDAVGMERAVLLGTSFGSRVAFDAALAAPQRVAAVVAAGPGLSGRASSPGLQSLLDEVDGALQGGDIDLANELEMRIWVDGVGRAHPVDAGVRAAIAAMNRPTLEREREGQTLQELPPRRPAATSLGAVRAPVLVLDGECDQPHCREAARLIVEAVPGARLVPLPEVAHVAAMERPDLVSDLVRGFIAGLAEPPH